MLDAKGDGIRLLLVVELVEQDRELVAAEAGEGVARPQARLEASGDSDQQRVANQVAQTVVDDLETIEVDIQRREALAAPFLHFFKPASKLLDEHRAIGQ